MEGAVEGRDNAACGETRRWRPERSVGRRGAGVNGVVGCSLVKEMLKAVKRTVPAHNVKDQSKGLLSPRRGAEMYSLMDLCKSIKTCWQPRGCVAGRRPAMRSCSRRQLGRVLRRDWEFALWAGGRGGREFLAEGAAHAEVRWPVRTLFPLGNWEGWVPR